MKKQNYIILCMTLLCNFKLHSMHRAILKNKAVNYAIESGAYTGAIGLIGSSTSKFFSDETLLMAATDIALTTAACGSAGAIIAAPVCFGYDAFTDSMNNQFSSNPQVNEFEYKLNSDAFHALKALSKQSDNLSAMDDLLKAQWSLHQFRTQHKDLLNMKASAVGLLACAGVPLSLTLLCQTHSIEIFVAGMSTSYFVAGVAVAKELLRAKKFKKAIRECSSFDKKNLSPEFIEKIQVMVTKVNSQFQPIRVDYENHTHWAQQQKKEKGEFYYPNINERIDAFDKVIINELENFKL